MKKLLSELEALKNEYNPQKYTTDADIVFGIEKAIIAVRAHNPWHEVGELPPVDENDAIYSINVLMTNGLDYDIGYYVWERKYWNTGIVNPTHWTCLPEVKP